MYLKGNKGKTGLGSGLVRRVFKFEKSSVILTQEIFFLFSINPSTLFWCEY